MAATPDRSLGFFSAVCSRLRAASSAWRRSDAGTHTGQDHQAAVRSRLARRATAARRFGRSLTFFSFNLEVLLFVYAFWRPRRRNLNWRQPLQALPMLVIPALAALIYAAFVRFTRTLDLKDRKSLQRLQQQNDSGSHHNEQDSAKKCDAVDDATSYSSEFDLPETSNLGKHHRPSIDLRDDGGGDGSWDHGKDFQPMHSDGLRQRILSIEKTHITNSSPFRQLMSWTTEHLSDDPEDPNHMEGTIAEHHGNSGPHVVEDCVACSTVQISSSLPACSIVHMISNATDHADFASSFSCPKSNGGLTEEDAVQMALTWPKSDLPAIAELPHAGVENKYSRVHVSEDNRMLFISDKQFVLSSYAVKNIERHPGTSGFNLSSQETEKEDIAGGFCCVKISPELSFLSSPGLVVESVKDASEKESCKLDKMDENDVAVISEEEAMLGLPVVTTAEPNYGTSGFSLHAQDSNMLEVPAVINISSVLPESNHPASLELLVENNEDSRDAEASDVNSPEQKGQEDFLDPLVVDSFKDSFATSGFLSHRPEADMAEVLSFVKEGLSEGASNLDPLVADSFEDSFATSGFLSCSMAAEMTEVLGVIKEGLSGGASNHKHDIAASSDDGDDTENAISDYMSIQVIPEDNITEALQDSLETLPDPLHRISFCSGIFLSSSEISNDEDHSCNSSSHTLYANSEENEEPLATASKGGGPGSKDEMNFAFLDTSILLNKVASAESWIDNAGCSQSIPESKTTQFLHDGKEALLRTSGRANFGLEESLISLDQEINLEIFSLYSRSSSCVSEVNMTETLTSGTFPALENDNDFHFDEMTSMMIHTNNVICAEFIPEINMTETLNVGKEATAGLEQELCSNFDISLKPPDVGNSVEKCDNSLDLRLWSFDPVVDASEGLQAAQEFSKLQSENDFTFVEVNTSTKEVNEDVVHVTNITGDLQSSKETSADASESAQPGLSESQDESV